jgi:hypothetical protein
MIDAVLYDGYEANHLDEAISIRNLGNGSVELGGWSINDGEPSRAYFPAGATIAPGQVLWLTKHGAAFLRQFGFQPDFELLDTYSLTIPNLTGSWPQLADTGDQLALYDGGALIVDCLVYELGATSDCGTEWVGGPVWPYKVGNLFAEDGQILYRRRDQVTGLPVPDTNTAGDWAQSADDVINGRKLRYPGWDLDAFFFTARLTGTARLTVAIAPDNAYEAIASQIDVAQSTIVIETLTFENIAIGDALIRAAARGVSVTLLLEGDPTGGLPDAEKYNCMRIESAGGQCWFMINEAAQQIHDRYRYLHAKFMIVDGQQAIIASENLSPNSLPDDYKGDGTWGRRGVILIVDSPGMANRLQLIFDHDFGGGRPRDIFRWSAGHPTYGPPQAGYLPVTETGGVTYTVRHGVPSSFLGELEFEIIQSPENSLRDEDALLGLVNRADAGDTLLVQQMSERPHWGPSSSNPLEDPNPRLEAYLNAARRGARVRLLLDDYFDVWDDPTSNHATCVYVKTVARSEQLDLDCALANPAGLGIHNKMVLAQINERGFVHVGSINGAELSNKANREVALQVKSDGAYALLAEMFLRDWPYRSYLPLVFMNYLGPSDHPLISEIHYDPPGMDEAEFIELVNPTGSPVDISGFGLGDAVHPGDFEDMRRFPAGTLLPPRTTLVVAASAIAFIETYGFQPDFELLDTDPDVINLIDDPNWGDPAAWLQLGNSGDEVILRDPADHVIDAVAYGVGSFPGVVSCALVTIANASLERFPYWRDSDDCTVDFRAWPFSNPGSLP